MMIKDQRKGGPWEAARPPPSLPARPACGGPHHPLQADGSDTLSHPPGPCPSPSPPQRVLALSSPHTSPPLSSLSLPSPTWERSQPLAPRAGGFVFRVTRARDQDGENEMGTRVSQSESGTTENERSHAPRLRRHPRNSASDPKQAPRAARTRTMPKRERRGEQGMMGRGGDSEVSRAFRNADYASGRNYGNRAGPNRG